MILCCSSSKESVAIQKFYLKIGKNTYYKFLSLKLNKVKNERVRILIYKFKTINYVLYQLSLKINRFTWRLNEKTKIKIKCFPALFFFDSWGGNIGDETFGILGEWLMNISKQHCKLYRVIKNSPYSWDQHSPSHQRKESINIFKLTKTKQKN